MTQEEKQLLLQVLCAMLPHGVKIHYHYSNSLGRILDEDRELDFSDVETLKYNIENPQNDWCEISWKPYLRPMSSMTEDEKRMLWEELDKDTDIICENLDAPIVNTYNGRIYRGNPVHHEIDFLNKNHFDWRGLIPMGLALEAPEDMYNTKTE